ncbi:MAG: hypothetical protein IMF19_12770 [Proteobacteria bacterium]|nr:hypothetical protein [Pseudomonadota bacterium]
MENICIDTDILIDHLRGHLGTVEEIRNFEGIFYYLGAGFQKDITGLQKDIAAINEHDRMER